MRTHLAVGNIGALELKGCTLDETAERGELALAARERVAADERAAAERFGTAGDLADRKSALVHTESPRWIVRRRNP
jgi:hypothetical protein